MDTFRFWVTDLDAIQYYLDSDQSDDDLRERLTGVSRPTPIMKAGSAFHKILERVGKGEEVRPEWGQFKQDGHSFRLKTNIEIDTPRMVEERIEWWTEVAGRRIQVRGRADALVEPNILVDYKLVSSYNAERYMLAWQWKASLCAVPDARTFRYDAFIRRGRNPFWNITDHHQLDLHRYDEMENDVKGHIAHCLDIADMLGWTGRPKEHRKQLRKG